MDEQTARLRISVFFPDLKIYVMKKLGEGTGNVAFEVNTDFVFRFPKKYENQQQLEREISIQKLVKKYSSLPIPEFLFLPQDHSFVGYRKLVGTQLLYSFKDFQDWESFSRQIGRFLSSIHAITGEELNKSKILREKKSFVDWQKNGEAFYKKTRFLIPKRYFSKIETFFHSKHPDKIDDLVFCHNDLGIEHILITESKVTGIIDWGVVTITDPACDFARIYRDVGERVLDSVIAKYSTVKVNKDELRVRAIFYGKCLLFEDLYYSIEYKEYMQKSLAALDWIFSY